MSTVATLKHSAFRRLTIQRYRGILDLSWTPNAGVNFILGGGDAGKSTLLEAVALLLNPNPNATVSDTDYWERDVAKGFVIEGVIMLADSVPIHHQKKINWPWHWDGKELLPAAAEGGGPGETVYLIRARGTEDLELVYEVVQPDGTAEPLPSVLRRAIGLVRLSGEERNDRDLRLVQGSALDRVLDDPGFRARAARDLATEPVGDLLDPKAKTALGTLSDDFKKNALPAPLGVGITGAAGFSLNALIGLTAPKGAASLPLTSWGAGTRRLASLTTAATLHDNSPIMLVDEVERGLECYRQRALVRTLQAGSSQVFVTTHSPVALRAASNCAVWYLDLTGRIGELNGTAVERQLAGDPEAFLARFTVVAEGATEVGFVTELLQEKLDLPLADYGIHVTDAGSNEGALHILSGLRKAGLAFAGMADNEGTNAGGWAAAQKDLGPKLCRWDTGCLEETLLALVPDGQLEAFIADPEDAKTGMRLRTLADRLQIADKSFAAIQAKASTGLRDLIIEACCGKVPDAQKSADKKVRKTLQSHAQCWFKSIEGGHELAAKVLSFGLWPKLEAKLLPFINAIRQGAGLAATDGFKE